MLIALLALHASAGDLVHKVEPVYPAEARALELGDARCLVAFTIGTDGVPTIESVAECHDLFKAEAERAIAQWRWQPEVVDGVAVAVEKGIALNFELTEAAPAAVAPEPVAEADTRERMQGTNADGNPITVILHPDEPWNAYPKKLEKKGPKSATCTVALRVDTVGLPRDIEVGGCPAELAGALERRLGKASWDPPMLGETPVDAWLKREVVFTRP